MQIHDNFHDVDRWIHLETSPIHLIKNSFQGAPAKLQVNHQPPMNHAIEINYYWIILEQSTLERLSLVHHFLLRFYNSKEQARNKWKNRDKKNTFVAFFLPYCVTAFASVASSGANTISKLSINQSKTSPPISRWIITGVAELTYDSVNTLSRNEGHQQTLGRSQTAAPVECAID